MSPLDRLAVVGHRGMGALTYAPESEAPLVLADVDLHTIADEVKEVISGDGEQLLRKLILMGGSPHGVRPKAWSMSTRPAITCGIRTMLPAFRGL